MNPKNKKSGIKINPLKRRSFDIRPPKGQLKKPLSSKNRDLKLFVIIAVVIFIVLNIFNIYERVIDIAYESKNTALSGYDSMQKAIQYASDKNYKKASTWFKEAERSFKTLEKSTKAITLQHKDLTTENLYLDTANKLVESGILISKLGQDLISLTEAESKIPEIFIKQIKSGKGEVKITNLINAKKNDLDKIYNEIITLQNNLTSLNVDIIPNDIKTKLTRGQNQIGEIVAIMREFNLEFETLLTLLGDKVPHRYLVLFQNNHELRATGGFIGSYMLIDINDGLITKMDAKDVYESDGQLTEIIIPPPGIDKVAKRLYLRDANYSPDFPTSAEKIMWFLEHSGQPSVDTVIAIDQNVVEEILKITGPITLENFPFQIKSNTFNNLISYYIEAKISKTGTPKQMLFDFIPVFKEKLLNVKNLIELKNTIVKLSKSKNIQAYSKDTKVQNLIEKLNLDGSLKKPQPKSDYLAVISTSIGGNKSDGFIGSFIDHKTKIDSSGGITNTLSITKEHNWNADSLPNLHDLIDRYGTGDLDLNSLLFILGQGRNLDYMRVYVPLGSKLIKFENIENIEVSKDLGYTVFGFTFPEVESGKFEKVTLKYELPFNLDFDKNSKYLFTAEKQAGASDIILQKTVEAIENAHIATIAPSPTNPFDLSPIYQINFIDSFNTEIFLINKEEK